MYLSILLLFPLLGFFTHGITVTQVLGFIKDFSILLKFFRYYYPGASLLFAILSASLAVYAYLIPSFLPFLILFCFCVIGILLSLTLLSFNYVTNPTLRILLIGLTIILTANIICIIAYFSFRLVKDLWDFVLKMESSQQPGNNSGNTNGSPNPGSSNAGPSNNGNGNDGGGNNGGGDNGGGNNGGSNNNNNNNHGVNPDDRNRQDKENLKQRLEAFIPHARAAKIAAGQDPDFLKYSDLREVSERFPRPLTWTECDLLKRIIRDAGGPRYPLQTTAVSTSNRARLTIDRIF